MRLEQPDAGLRPGLTGDAEIVTAERTNVLTVPLQSVVLRTDAEGRERSGVFVVEKGENGGNSANGVVRFTPVTTGAIGGLDIEVDGVAAGSKTFEVKADAASDVTPLQHKQREAFVFEVIDLQAKVDALVKDIVARWKADPQSLATSLGSSRGSTTHYLIAQIAKAAGVDPRRLKLVTFGGASDSVVALLGGHIDMLVTAPGNAIEQHKAGAKLTVIGSSRTGN